MEIKDALEVTLAGDLHVTSGGIGASAAASVAIAKALVKLKGLSLSLQELNQLAYTGECSIHGMPSGTDNTAALYGGLFLYDKVSGRSVIKVTRPLYCVIVDSGHTANTALAIMGLKDKIVREGRIIGQLFKCYEQLVPVAVKAIQEADWQMLGQLMLENHRILRQMDLSCDLLDFMVDRAMQEGALGAKLSGSGKGGIMIALVADKEKQQKVKKAFERDGFWTSAVTLDYTTEDAHL